MIDKWDSLTLVLGISSFKDSGEVNIAISFIILLFILYKILKKKSIFVPYIDLFAKLCMSLNDPFSQDI